MANTQQPDQGRQTPPQVSQQVTSASQLSQSGDDNAEDGRFSVAEEVNLDEQSDQARRVGQPPEGQGDPSEAMARSLQQGQDEAGAGARENLQASIERAVPRGD
ncbi:hypothetical protein [Noviherbaspirillum aridicola]|uniref:Uncharacterized protein n=1 Tax=Noviherbaspirillum aridicola TaxID=2849687 RepID=A0ABQ4PZW1_9BURK|nr:hypothetical protein [Noviherbaspirillum aridicola]GIZ50414.1 hypothetical protein NCCP691_04280 [Noviherbaspirillum aridicola]